MTSAMVVTSSTIKGMASWPRVRMPSCRAMTRMASWSELLTINRLISGVTWRSSYTPIRP